MTRVLAVSAVREVMGTEHSLLNVAPSLTSQGVSLMLAAQGGGSFERRWAELRLPFFVLNLPVRQGFRPNSGKGYNGIGELARLPLRTLRAVREVADVVRSSRADVIHSNCLVTHFDCAIVGRITRTTSVLELHDIVAPGVGRVFMGLAVRLSDKAIAISAAVRDQLPRWARDNVVVIPQSVDVERFDHVCADDSTWWRRHLAEDAEVPIVAAIGRIDPEKGLHVLIRAVALVRESGLDVQLAVIGSPAKDDGSHLAELRSLGSRLMGDAVRFIPQVTDVGAVLGAVDVLVCPSDEEPFGLILLEAQACRVPVVASASGGPAEFIDHGETGMLFPPGDAHALARVLARLLTDPDFRAHIAAVGQIRARTHYTVQIRADRFASLYRSLVASG